MTSEERPIVFFFGTTAELIKLWPVLLRLKESGRPFRIIASGQNRPDDSFLWREVQRSKDFYLLAAPPEHATPLHVLIWWLRVATRFLLKPIFLPSGDADLVVHGDTISTLLGALVAWRFGYRLLHIEAGLTSKNLWRPFPEEICRQLVSRLTKVAFCPNAWACENLKSFTSLKINTEQNTLIEATVWALKQPFTPLSSLKSYFLLVIHRQENLFDAAFMKEVLSSIVEARSAVPAVFILHEPTQNVLQKLSSELPLPESSFRMIPRQSYSDFVHLLKNAEFVVTDGGSNQEECFYFGQPCFLLRRETERIEGLGQNVLLGGHNLTLLKSFLQNPQAFRRQPQSLQAQPSQKIVDFLLRKEGLL